MDYPVFLIKGEFMKVFLKYFTTILFSTSLLFPVSEAGAVWLLINPGASAQGTGEAQVAKSNDAYASYYNPAGLAYIDKSQIVLQHVNWLPNLATDVYFDYLAFARPLGRFGTIGGNIRYLSLGEQMQTNSQGVELGMFKSYMIAAQMSYGTTLTPNSSIGFSFKVFHQRLADMAVEAEGQAGGADEGSSTDLGFDFGYLMHFGKNKQHSFGLAIHNIGPPIDFVDAEQADPAPTNMKLGFKLQLSKTNLNELNFLFDMNKLLVASYPAMDWNDDGIISGSDEIAHSDEWYKGIANAWLDDWYYGGDYDESITSNYSTVDLIGDFWFSQVDLENSGYADGRIGGYEKEIWSHVDHGDDLIGSKVIGGNDWEPVVVDINSPVAAVYVPNYAGFCNEMYRTFIGYDSANGDLSDTGTVEEYSMCYDSFGTNFDPSNPNDPNYGGHEWIDMPHDGFGSVDRYDVNCDADEDYDCTVDTPHNQALEFDFDHDEINEVSGNDIIQDTNQGYTRMDVQYHRADDGAIASEFNYSDSRYGIYNPYGFAEKGSGDDRTFQKELEEVIFNLGFEYEYSENFTLRAGFIYDLEGDVKNPTLGAGINFINYGFDFGYTLGDTGSPRSNTMFFSLKIDV